MTSVSNGFLAAMYQARSEAIKRNGPVALCKSATGLAISRDLDQWEWQGVVLAPGASGWDRYCRRLNSVVPLTPPDGAAAARNGGTISGRKYLGFYDGSASHLENYEEQCGLAVSENLRDWQSITPKQPALTSPHASTSLRYLDAKFAKGAWHLFYEFARADGAHDMRMITCDAAALGDWLR